MFDKGAEGNKSDQRETGWAELLGVEFLSLGAQKGLERCAPGPGTSWPDPSLEAVSIE